MMATFQCDRYPQLRVGDGGVQFTDGRLDTDDEWAIKVCDGLDYVTRVDADGGEADEFVPEASHEPDDEPVVYARHTGRGWYALDDDLGGRKYRRDEIPDGYTILDDEGDRE